MRYAYLGLAAAALTAGAHAQQANKAEPATNPQAMPGDYFDIPQSVQLKVPLGPPAGPNPNKAAKPVASAPGPDALLALEAARAAEESCRADGYAIAVAVTDAAGNLKAALAADGTRSNGIYMAMHKAVTVVGFKLSTLELRGRIEQEPSLMAQVRPNMSLLPGGLPIVRNGTFIGAIATSGAAAHEEEKCAQAGIAVILGPEASGKAGG